MHKYIFTIFLLLFTIKTNAQDEWVGVNLDSLELDSDSLIIYDTRPDFPIVFSKAGTEYQKKFKVVGTIKNQSGSEFACGIFCFAGTLEIEIKRSNLGIDLKRIFVLVPCLTNDDERIGRKIKMVITNLPEDRDIGCFSDPINKLDSKGEVFYYCESYEYK
tara:strand:- start:201 stop:683 length:483 start_codon:yes stop_codon:yes gene_type:complete